MLNSSSKRHGVPAVAIGVPVYNGERYIGGALDALLAQTYRDFEIVICDNCSTDRTEDICRGYAARFSNIRYYRNARNLGASPNFNLTFRLSSSPYFKWAACDDSVEPEFLARCIGVLESDSSAVLCFSNAKVINGNGAFETTYNPGPDASSADAARRFRDLILHPEYAIQQMGVIRADALRSTRLHGSYPSSDEVLLAELALRGAFARAPERLYVYRRHEHQSTSVPKQRDRKLFFDTALNSRIILPTWRYLLAGVSAVRRAPVAFPIAAKCYVTLLQWVARPDHARALLKDLALALSSLMRLTITNAARIGHSQQPRASKHTEDRAHVH